jgi:hypothetical protein
LPKANFSQINKMSGMHDNVTPAGNVCLRCAFQAVCLSPCTNTVFSPRA